MVKHIFKPIFSSITGREKRIAAATIALEYGCGGQTFVSNELNMSRCTVRKGIREIKSGEKIEDKFNQRGRKKFTEQWPELTNQIKTIMDAQSQADPKFQTDRLYTNMSIKEVRNQLIQQFGYTDEELPTVRTLNTIANENGYTLRTVKKTNPIKTVPETEFIFENLDRLHRLAAEDENIIRLSIDTKDKVKIGEFSRGGMSRVDVNAYDHDFGDDYIVPFGIMNVKEKTAAIYLSETKVTADFMVDRLEEYWIENGYFNSGKTLLINADNGSENNSSRTQFIKRLVEFSIEANLDIVLAYYPPYHSKYNPIERYWGVLEKHWNGSLLDSELTVKNFIETMTYDKRHPTVEIIDWIYKTGKKVPNRIMNIYEKALTRVAGLEKWFLKISPQKSLAALTGYMY